MKESGFKSRKDIRLKNYDYSQSGYYFVTICTYNRKNILCHFVGADDHGSPFIPEIIFTDTGIIIDKYINYINKAYENVKLDCYVIMPNHIHLIIAINNLSIDNTLKISLPQIINSFKVITSKKCGSSIWQRNYYEHIIRNEKDLTEIREYIQNNPINWSNDKLFSK